MSFASKATIACHHLANMAMRPQTKMPPGWDAVTEYDIAARLAYMRDLHAAHLAAQAALAQEINEHLNAARNQPVGEYVTLSDDAFADLNGGFRRIADDIAQSCPTTIRRLARVS